MKKITERRRRWFAIRRRSQARKQQRRQTFPGTGQTTHPSGVQSLILDFDRHTKVTLEVIEDIRRALHSQNEQAEHPGSVPSPSNPRKPAARRPEEVLRHLERISPAAALVIAAEYERAGLTQSRRLPIPDATGISPPVLAVLQEIGFFHVIGLGGQPHQSVLTEDNMILTMRSGSTTDTHQIDSLIHDLKQLYPTLNDQSTEGLIHLYGAMVEAIGNVVDHAYPPGGSYPLPSVGRWWITGAVNRREKWTTAVVYDQGVTIPVSLPEWERYTGTAQRLQRYARHVLWRLVGRMTGLAAMSDPSIDGYAIQAAVEEAVSSTGEANRGRGLAQMREFIDRCTDGSLRIMSRHGQVTYRPGRRPVARAYDTSIGGTLIEWNVLT